MKKYLTYSFMIQLRNRKIIIPYISLVILLLIIGGFITWYSDRFTIAQFIVLLVMFLFIFGPLKKVFGEWTHPIVLIGAYEYFRGMADITGKLPYIYPMIWVDQKIFGFIPTNKLQSLLFSDGSIHFYDYYSSILYFIFLKVKRIL